jgi:E3 ubiquitin-protein ligase HUWE1
MDRLPQAHTCFNQSESSLSMSVRIVTNFVSSSVDLPQYSSYEMLRQQLLLAINEGGEGFSFA